MFKKLWTHIKTFINSKFNLVYAKYTLSKTVEMSSIRNLLEILFSFWPAPDPCFQTN